MVYRLVRSSLWVLGSFAILLSLSYSQNVMPDELREAIQSGIKLKKFSSDWKNDRPKIVLPQRAKPISRLDITSEMLNAVALQKNRQVKIGSKTEELRKQQDQAPKPQDLMLAAKALMPTHSQHLKKPEELKNQAVLALLVMAREYFEEGLKTAPYKLLDSEKIFLRMLVQANWFKNVLERFGQIPDLALEYFNKNNKNFWELNKRALLIDTLQKAIAATENPSTQDALCQEIINHVEPFDELIDQLFKFMNYKKILSHLHYRETGFLSDSEWTPYYFTLRRVKTREVQFMIDKDFSSVKMLRAHYDWNIPYARVVRKVKTISSLGESGLSKMFITLKRTKIKENQLLLKKLFQSESFFTPEEKEEISKRQGWSGWVRNLGYFSYQSPLLNTQITAEEMEANKTDVSEMLQKRRNKLYSYENEEYQNFKKRWEEQQLAFNQELFESSQRLKAEREQAEAALYNAVTVGLFGGTESLSEDEVADLFGEDVGDDLFGDEKEVDQDHLTVEDLFGPEEN